jgi:hypothetical protein
LHERFHHLEARRTVPYWMVLSRFFDKTRHLLNCMFTPPDVFRGGEDSHRLLINRTKSREKKYLFGINVVCLAKGEEEMSQKRSQIDDNAFSFGTHSGIFLLMRKNTFLQIFYLLYQIRRSSCRALLSWYPRRTPRLRSFRCVEANSGKQKDPIEEYAYCKRAWWLRFNELAGTTDAMRLGTQVHDKLAERIDR